MFEVLLQADKALASGALDQAERSYWQLIELDPTNAIAVAGLARVSMERGDQRLARTFADRALAMDPEMVAARRILDAIKGGASEVAAPEQPDLPLLAAQRLEALGRRRVAARLDEADEVDEIDEEESARGDRAKRPGEAGANDRVQLPQLPREPLPERRQAGREAAAAAAAAAEAGPRSQPPNQAAGRPKAHQALGDRARRNLLPDDLKPQPRAEDPFAAAESAATIEAIDQTEDVAIEEHPGRSGRGQNRATDPQGEVLGAVDATDEDDSIAMRVALVADADLEAAELDTTAPAGAQLASAQMAAAEPDAALEAADLQLSELEAAEFDEGVLGVAELVASEEFGPEPSRRIDLDALEAELAAAEQRAAERAAAEHRPPAEAAADDQVELSAAELASSEVATVIPATPPPVGDEATEEDAEAAALREALEVVLGGDAPDTPDRDEARPVQKPTEGPAEKERSAAAGRPGNSDKGRTAGSELDHPAGSVAESAAPADPAPEPRRKGLLRRFRGD
jgi:hypothetical protein